MSEPKGNKQDGEHIEELLSQLKGIFGHLSESEQEEARHKVSPPTLETPAPHEPKTAPSGEPALADSPGEKLTPLTEFSLAPEAAAEPEPAPVPQPLPTVPVLSLDSYIPTEATVPVGASLIPAAIFYPSGRLQEAKSCADKIERITPKFTRVAVVLNVQTLTVFDPKSDLKSSLLPQVLNSPIKAVFIIVDKSLEEARRKALAAELEPQGIYFHEILLQQIEKRALYTDILLGMVFFFDSQKPAHD